MINENIYCYYVSARFYLVFQDYYAMEIVHFHMERVIKIYFLEITSFVAFFGYLRISL